MATTQRQAWLSTSACAGGPPRADALGSRRAPHFFRSCRLDPPPAGGRDGYRPQKKSAQIELDALTFNFAGQLVDQLLRARPEGMDLEQLLEGLQGGLLLADLAQDLA